ncbi:MAG: hypothetical protein JWL99_3796 [Streptomyces oryziradicis]|nr:hypothetical protein [Actinacidiphila oryziradicis]
MCVSHRDAESDVRRIAAQLAHELRETFAAQGYALDVMAAPPMGGRAYVEFAPLNEDMARRLIDGLRRGPTT